MKYQKECVNINYENMTKKEKQLLLEDLCSRLPDGVIVQVKDWTTLDAELKTGHIRLLQEDEIELKPYLRPLSSMTEEEKKEYKHLVSFSGSPEGAANFVNWLNKKMFAYRTIDDKDMFELGLAIDVTKENNPYIKLNCHDIRRKIFMSN